MAASPSLGDGLMVSNFHLWMHVLEGIGKGQEWIKSMAPDYLAGEYGREDGATMDDHFPMRTKPVQTKLSSGYTQGDPFEIRKVVLNESLLSQAKAKVTMGPKGPALRESFLQRLEATMAHASRPDDRVLVIIFSPGY